jgi:hypothetical protein
MTTKTITSVATINPGQLKDDKVAAIANAMGVSTEKATALVARFEKQQAYRKAYAAKRYQQMKQVASLLK